MPHCPYRLYVNLLWDNWDNLENVIIVGNSFSSYALRRSLTQGGETAAEERSDCVRLLRELCTQVPLWEAFWEGKKGRRRKGGPLDASLLEGAFCDTSVHYFPIAALQSDAGRRILSARPSRADIEEAARHDVELFSDDDDDNDVDGGSVEEGVGDRVTPPIVPASTPSLPLTPLTAPAPAQPTTGAVEEEIVGAVACGPLFSTNILPQGCITLPSGRKITCRTRSMKAFNDLLFVDDIWPGARCLVDHLLAHPALYRDKDVLELGAGGALPGLVVAADGARWVVITDYPAPGVIENIDGLIGANGLTGVARTVGHVWGAENVAELLMELQTSATATVGTATTSGETTAPPAAATATRTTAAATTPAATAASTSSETGTPPPSKKFDLVIMAELLWKDTYPLHRRLLESLAGSLDPITGVGYAAFAHRPTEECGEAGGWGGSEAGGLLHEPALPLAVALPGHLPGPNPIPNPPASDTHPNADTVTMTTAIATDTDTATTTTATTATATTSTPTPTPTPTPTAARTVHTAAHDLEFFAAASRDFGLTCRHVATDAQYHDVGTDTPAVVNIIEMRFSRS
jgi:predicted nicotinamide N-methyase